MKFNEIPVFSTNFDPNQNLHNISADFRGSYCLDSCKISRINSLGTLTSLKILRERLFLPKMTFKTAMLTALWFPLFHCISHYDHFLLTFRCTHVHDFKMNKEMHWVPSKAFIKLKYLWQPSPWRFTNATNVNKHIGNSCSEVCISVIQFQWMQCIRKRKDNLNQAIFKRRGYIQIFV